MSNELLGAVKGIRFDKNAASNEAAPTTTIDWSRSSNGVFRSGFWSSEPGTSRISYDKDEICTLLEGKVRLTDESGNAEIYEAGDTFLIPNGFKGEWETIASVHKFFAVYEP